MSSPRPHICILLGPKKSGKTSIVNVVLDDIEPNSTLYNEPTRVPWVKKFNAFLDFELWDLPGGRYDIEHIENLDLGNVGSCIFVVDAQAFQGDSTDQARKMAAAVFRINNLNPKTTFEIFIHKVDGMSETYRADVQQDLRNRVMDELNDLADMEGFATSQDYVFPLMSYHFTSIYQSSVYDALSKVISRLLPCQGALERLLDILCTQSSFDKAYIFDLASKLYFATDSTPGDAATLELCSEYIDLHWDFDQIYSLDEVPQESEQDISPENPSSKLGVLAKKAVRTNFSGTVALSSGMALAHWELADNIALIARVNSRILAQHFEQIEANVDHFREAVTQVRDLEASR